MAKIDDPLIAPENWVEGGRVLPISDDSLPEMPWLGCISGTDPLGHPGLWCGAHAREGGRDLQTGARRDKRSLTQSRDMAVSKIRLIHPANVNMSFLPKIFLLMTTDDVCLQYNVVIFAIHDFVRSFVPRLSWP